MTELPTARVYSLTRALIEQHDYILQDALELVWYYFNDRPLRVTEKKVRTILGRIKYVPTLTQEHVDLLVKGSTKETVTITEEPEVEEEDPWRKEAHYTSPDLYLYQKDGSQQVFTLSEPKDEGWELMTSVPFPEWAKSRSAPWFYAGFVITAGEKFLAWEERDQVDIYDEGIILWVRR